MDHARRHLLVDSVPLDKTGRQEAPSENVALLDPLAPERARRIATLPGTGWGAFSFSFDDRRLAMVEFKSVEDTRVHVMDVATGQRMQVLPRPGEARVMSTSDVAFARDGAHLFLATDAGGEFRRAALLSLRTGQLRYFASRNGATTSRVSLPRTTGMISKVMPRSRLFESTHSCSNRRSSHSIS